MFGARTGRGFRRTMGEDRMGMLVTVRQSAAIAVNREGSCMLTRMLV